MDDFNRVLSFVLGVIVVVVFFVILFTRFNVRDRLLSLTSRKTPTVTVKPTLATTPKPSKTPVKASPTKSMQTGTTRYDGATPTPKIVARYQTPPTKGQTLNTIPNTGASTVLLPFALSSLLAGIYLRRK